MKIESISQAQDFLYSYIPKETDYKFPGDFGLKRTEYLLQLLGNPQDKIKVIHIAGTSGKGSTAHYISYGLQSQNLKVGLHISPHLLDIRERYQINNSLLSEAQFVTYLNEIIPAICSMETTKFGVPTYFEINVALAYYIFFKERVDYAVIETGLGGLYDGTNVVHSENKVAVITRIGHDHTEILGKTLAKIASQKAGIIHEKNTVITLCQKSSPLGVIRNVSKQKHAMLHLVKKNKNYHIKDSNENKIEFDFSFFDEHFKTVTLDTPALYQVENDALALATIVFISKRDNFLLQRNILIKSFTTSFAGRLEIKHIKNKTVIIDGAHNPQKMAAFILSLKKMYPDKKLDFLIAIKRGKDFKYMLDYILPVAKSITITTFFSTKQGLKIMAMQPEIIVTHLKKNDYKNYRIIANTQKAVDDFFASAKKDRLVITGSLYLLSEIYPILN